MSLINSFANNFPNKTANGLSNERGNIAPLAVIAVFLLLTVMSFAVDVGIAYCAKDRQEQTLDAARSACMDVVVSQQAKYADDPGNVVAYQIVQTIRNQGFSGPVEVWFYEAPKGAVPESQRYWVIGMQVSQAVPTVFAQGFGYNSIEAASCRVIEARPYASQKVWRPDQRTCGKYSFAQGQNTGRFSAINDLDGFPAEMIERVRASE